MCDFSRTWPPEAPTKASKQHPELKNCHLFRLLRPELVQSYPKPLCSDAFTKFIPDHIQAQVNGDIGIQSCLIVGSGKCGNFYQSSRSLPIFSLFQPSVSSLSSSFVTEVVSGIPCTSESTHPKTEVWNLRIQIFKNFSLHVSVRKDLRVGNRRVPVFFMKLEL